VVNAKVQIALLQMQGKNDSQAIQRLQARIETLTNHLKTQRQPNDTHIWAAAIAVITAVLLFIGRYQMIQTVSIILVAIFTLVTFITVALLQTRPGWRMNGQDLIHGLSFHLPPIIEGITQSPVATALAAFGIIGVGAAELIMYPYWCLEKGYARFTGPRDGSAQWFDRARGWMRVMRADAWISMVVYTFATAAFYLLGAAVLRRARLDPGSEDMVRTLAQMYVPVFGSWAHLLFLFGAFAVLYSTFFVACAGNARMTADGLGLLGLVERSEASRLRWSRILSGAFPLIALVLYLFLQAPVAMILASGTCQAIMLPMLGGAALYFRYRRCESQLRPGRLWDLMLWLSFGGFLIIGTWTALTTFLPQLTKAHP
jgi:Mn2+/Fe2+ NRAMP family transporter